MDATLKHDINQQAYSLSELWQEVTKGTTKKNTLGYLEIFTEHNQRLKESINKTHSIRTLQKFKSIYTQVQDFIQLHHKKEDLPINSLTMKFLVDLEHYLLTERNLKQVSVNKTIQRVKKIIRYAMMHDYLDKNPFLQHKIKTVHLEPVFLSPEELARVENKKFDSNQLELSLIHI